MYRIKSFVRAHPHQPCKTKGERRGKKANDLFSRVLQSDPVKWEQSDFSYLPGIPTCPNKSLLMVSPTVCPKCVLTEVGFPLIRLPLKRDLTVILLSTHTLSAEPKNHLCRTHRGRGGEGKTVSFVMY